MGVFIMTRLYLVRHCETNLNQQKVYYGRIDCPLNQNGILQAELLRECFKDIELDVIISSPLKRCTETTNIIKGDSGQQIRLEPDFIELDFGLWEGLHYKEISEKYPEEWEGWVKDWKNATPPKGESFAQMYTRVKKALDRVLKEHQGKNVLVVTHKGCLQLIASILLSGDDRLFWNLTFEHGRYSLFELSDENCLIKKLNIT